VAVELYKERALPGNDIPAEATGIRGVRHAIGHLAHQQFARSYRLIRD
jgi:hypothetical protein